MADSCGLSDPRKRAAAIESYTALHEGLPPRTIGCATPPDAQRARQVPFGVATRIQYFKRIPGEPGARFKHPWKSYAQPTLVVDRNEPLRGALNGAKRTVVAGRRDFSFGFLAGRYETTRRGIEDRVLPGMKTEGFTRQPYVSARETSPVAQSPLTTLGKMEWIEYKGLDDAADAPVRRLVFPASTAPEIAHDAHGNLYILTSQNVITERGVEPMAHRMSSEMMRYDNPRRRRSSRRRAHRNPSKRTTVMVTPSKIDNSGAYSMIVSSLLVGTIAVATAVGMDMLLGRVLPATVGRGARAGIKIGVGLLGGLGLAYLLRNNANKYLKTIPAGFSVGGVFSGGADLYAMYLAPMWTQQAPAQIPAQNTTPVGSTPAPINAAHQALLPGSFGIPSGYAAYSRAGCAVS